MSKLFDVHITTISKMVVYAEDEYEAKRLAIQGNYNEVVERNVTARQIKSTLPDYCGGVTYKPYGQSAKKVETGEYFNISELMGW